ncbi:MAG: hypothetical protein IJ074_07610 [Clostridia bacterium]|nr:hypothetical protein [Clostridia bacterium]
MVLATVSSCEDLISRVHQTGFLPFFSNGIEGFSLEECAAPSIWFVDGVDGPWEWKGAVIQTGIVYAKLWGGKAAFVTRPWYMELANVRRNGGDFDTLMEEGALSKPEIDVYRALLQEGSMLSRTLRVASGFQRRSAFDAVLAKLQMKCLIAIEDFEYDRDAHGKPYGWGVARYTTVDRLLGGALERVQEERSPDASRRRLLDALKRLAGVEYEKKLLRMIG